MRFETSKSEAKEIGLDAYIANMKEGQKSIYYLAGQQPFLTQLEGAAADGGGGGGGGGSGGDGGHGVMQAQSAGWSAF